MRIKPAFLMLAVVLAALVAFNYYNIAPKGIVTASIVERSEGLLVTYERVRYPANATVVSPDSDMVGFDMEKHSLNFGVIPAGGGAGRFLDIKNPENRVIKIRIETHGNISEFITLGESEIILEPGEERSVEISFDPEDATEPGEYSGEIDITKIISMNPLADAILGWL